jgi:enterochelin esterase-like enzyme
LAVSAARARRAAAAGFSVGAVLRQISGASRSARARHYLAAGTPEPGCRRSARECAERLLRAGLPCRHQEWASGHDQVWWQQHPVALGRLLRA